MFKSNNFTANEAISLSNEIAKVAITDTPLTSLLMARGAIEKANSTVYTWREKTLDTTADITAVEGSDPTFYESGRAELSNVLEIFSKGATVSGSANAMSVSGQGGIFSEEIADRLIELKVNMEKALTTSTLNNGSTTPFKRRMDGLDKWGDASNAITTAASGIVTANEVKQLVKNLWSHGLSGEFYGLCNADIKEQIDAHWANSVTYQAPVNTFGVLVQRIVTNYGNLNLILSRHCPINKLIAFDASYLALAFLRQAAFEPLAKTGDAVKGMVVAEGTLKCGSKKAVGVLTLKA